MKNFQAKLNDYSCNDRFDKFYFDVICIKKYKEVYFVVLTLNHGQAMVERGLSNSNNLVKANMNPGIVIVKPLVKDHMLFHQLKPYTIKITSSMIKAFRGAHIKYKLHLEEEKEKQTLNDSDQEMLHLSGDIENLQTKVRQIEKAVTMMDEEAFEFMRLAEEESDLSCVIEGNCLKHKSEELKYDINVLENKIEVLKDKKHKLQKVYILSILYTLCICCPTMNHQLYNLE